MKENLIDAADYSGTLENDYYVQCVTGFELTAGVTYTLSLDLSADVEPVGVGIGAGSTSYTSDIVYIKKFSNGHADITFTPTEEQLTNGAKLFIRCPRYNEKTTTNYTVSNIRLVLETGGTT